MGRWNEIEEIMKELVRVGKTQETDDFFFELKPELPAELEPYRHDILCQHGDFEFLWSQIHPMEA